MKRSYFYPKNNIQTMEVKRTYDEGHKVRTYSRPTESKQASRCECTTPTQKSQGQGPCQGHRLAPYHHHQD